MSNSELLRLRRIARAVAAGVGLRGDLADDVAQRTLLALLESNLPVHSPCSWVYAVARRTSFQTVRREARYVPPQVTDRDGDLPRFEERLDMQRAWRRLSVSDRQVLLHRVAQCSLEQTAESTGLSPSTVKRRLRRSRGILARVL